MKGFHVVLLVVAFVLTGCCHRPYRFFYVDEYGRREPVKHPHAAKRGEIYRQGPRMRALGY